MKNLEKLCIILLLVAGMSAAGCLGGNPAPVPVTNTQVTTIAPMPAQTSSIFDVSAPGGQNVHVESGTGSNYVHVDIPASGLEGPKVVDIRIEK